ncbi:hypothetical protein Aeqsu_0336 [Aequorivita sublithincola DSM 14238]|uniref:Uncharacterized protein n=1 Tax=Aequorivita sublithincola (strain DSM 14238 / LMG 21431 / ACAM 643 / 9-3) TaxID=746697 RepID=I3YS82_AEQSU|nr:hypothetical protein [Aequorivita sublithincola]AFL79850.1 hypothetical protein Aeqsu_0336 [Aequorivita sublithincola DSM 14238]
MSQEGKTGIISFWLRTENPGDYDVIISDDYFKNKLTLPKGKYAMKEVSFRLELKNEKVKLENFIKKKFTIPYRLVYYIESKDDSIKDFIAIEQEAEFKDGKFIFKN